MSGICDYSLAAGLNGSCEKFPSRIKNIILTDSAVKFTNVADFENINSWKLKIKQSLSIYVPKGLANAEDTTEDPTINTTALGQKFVVATGTPSAKIMLLSNPCDFNEAIAKFSGGNYGIFVVLEDGSMVGYINSAGEVLPFSASVFAYAGKMHEVSAVENAFQLLINYRNADEHKVRVYRKPTWNPMIELPLLMPNGLSIVQTSAISSGVVSVYIATRCGAGKTGLVLADFEMLDTNKATLAVTTVTEVGLGVYTLTFLAGVTPPAAGEYLTLRVKKTVTSNVTDVSGNITLQA